MIRKLPELEWKGFLKNNQEIFDSRRIEPYGLGCEPEWLHQKRLRDRNK